MTSGLLGAALFASLMVLMVYFLKPGRFVTDAHGFGVITTVYSLHSLVGVFLLL